MIAWMSPRSVRSSNPSPNSPSWGGPVSTSWMPMAKACGCSWSDWWGDGSGIVPILLVHVSSAGRRGHRPWLPGSPVRGKIIGRVITPCVHNTKLQEGGGACHSWCTKRAAGAGGRDGVCSARELCFQSGLLGNASQIRYRLLRQRQPLTPEFLVVVVFDLARVKHFVKALGEWHSLDFIDEGFHARGELLKRLKFRDVHRDHQMTAVAV